MKSKQQPVKPTKGYLYEIRTQEGRLLGYLFGTLHKLSINKLNRLHPKVLSCFDKSSHLFLELEHPFPEEDISSPKGVDELLYKRAIAQNKEVKGLETELSRQEIAKRLRVEEKKSHCSVRAEGIVLITFYQALVEYNQLTILLNKVKDIGDISPIIRGVKEVLPLIDYVIENQKFFPIMGLDDELFTLIDGITEFIYLLGVMPPNQDNFLRKRLLAQRQYEQKNFSNSFEEKDIVRKYVDGDNSNKRQVTSKCPHSLGFSVKKYEDELTIKESQGRDAVMAETIHKDLIKTILTQGNRCGFYAPGASHVVGAYPKSLPFLLEQKGFILNKVEMHSVLQQEHKSNSADNVSFNEKAVKQSNMQLLVPLKNRFFSLKSVVLLEDHTPVDPYGSGAIVPVIPPKNN